MCDNEWPGQGRGRGECTGTPVHHEQTVSEGVSPSPALPSGPGAAAAVRAAGGAAHCCAPLHPAQTVKELVPGHSRTMDSGNVTPIHIKTEAPWDTRSEFDVHPCRSTWATLEPVKSSLKPLAGVPA